MNATLDVSGLGVRYPVGGVFRARTQLQAVRDVSFTLAPGKTLGVVGESGCGKSSLARALLRLAPVSEGSITWGGRDLTTLDEDVFRKVRPDIQMVFQDPFASLNPRMSMADLIAEPLLTHHPEMTRAARRERVAEVVEQIGLRPDMMDRFPHEFSGGQAQRIGIARAIVSRPKVLICDEAVSALDVSVQALILKLLKRIQAELDLAILFIGHDLSVIRHVSDRVVVLYLGRVMEDGARAALFSKPLHPYTQLLIGSALSTDPGLERGRDRPVAGDDLPSPMNPPSGCVFHTRCPLATDICRDKVPERRAFGADHHVACHHAESAAEKGIIHENR